MECTYVKENLLEARNNILYPELVKMFKHLLSIETISALRLQALHSNQKDIVMTISSGICIKGCLMILIRRLL